MDIYMNQLINNYDSDYNVIGYTVSLYGKNKDDDLSVNIHLTSDDFAKGTDLSNLTAANIRPVAIKKAISYLK